MKQTLVRKSIRVRAPLAHVFERLADHEAMARWPGVAGCRLIRAGEPRNGVGAIREIKAGGLTMQEEVVRFEPPRGYEYMIIRGLPVRHRGQVALADEGDAVRVTWEVRLSSRVPLLAAAVGFALGRGLDRALPFFAAEAERAA